MPGVCVALKNRDDVMMWMAVRRTGRCGGIQSGLVGLALALAVASQADVLRLKNGNRMEGVIRAETAADYQMDLGFGTVGIPKAQVAGVERASDDARARWEAARRTQFILHEKYVPAGQRDLLAAWQALETQRAGALKAQRTVTDLQQALAREPQEAAQLLAQEASTSSRLSLPTHPTRTTVAQYNQAVTEVNELRTRLMALQQKAPEQQAALDQGRRESARYTGALLRFADQVKQRKALGAGTDDPQMVAVFFAAVEARLHTFLGEIQQVQLPYQPDRRQVVVKARLNDLIEGLFLVDTGASTMSISEEFARRLNLPAGTPAALITLADGSTRKARTSRLRSVEIAGARMADVATVILPDQPGTGIDGLLGMNFISEFNIQLDTEAQVLRLNRFAPP